MSRIAGNGNGGHVESRAQSLRIYRVLVFAPDERIQVNQVKLKRRRIKNFDLKAFNFETNLIFVK